MTWRSEVSKCFGVVDQNFAMHEVEKSFARKLRNRLNAEGVSFADLKVAMVDHLHQKRCSPEHIQKQMKSIEKFFGKLT